MTRRVLQEFARRAPPPESARPDALDELTERELEVLTLVARGLSNAEIAEQLFITPGSPRRTSAGS